MRIVVVILFALQGTLAVQAAFGQAAKNPLGATLRFVMLDGGNLSGELLAAEADSVWLLRRGRIRPVPLAAVSKVQVRGRGVDREDLLLWTLIGGVVTGAALTGACSSVTEGCAGVFAGTLLSWGLVGGIAAAITGSPHRWVDPNTEALAPYARFPQGLPLQFVEE